VGTSTVAISSERAISAAKSGPLPPKAISVNSCGSRPRSMDTARTGFHPGATEKIDAVRPRGPEQARGHLAGEPGRRRLSSPPAAARCR
jgi:hypothetical protein